MWGPSASGCSFAWTQTCLLIVRFQEQSNCTDSQAKFELYFLSCATTKSQSVSSTGWISCLLRKLNLTFQSGSTMSDGRACVGAHMHVRADRLGTNAFLRLPTALHATLPAAFSDISLPGQWLLTSCKHGEQDRMRPHTSELLTDGRGHTQADCSARWP